jgi:cobalamin biosynthesis Co2+ chelatase CbiK
MIYFAGVYKRGYEFLIEDLRLFPKIRYNKIVERINRYEALLFETIGATPLLGYPKFSSSFS